MGKLKKKLKMRAAMKPYARSDETFADNDDSDGDAAGDDAEMPEYDVEGEGMAVDGTNASETAPTTTAAAPAIDEAEEARLTSITQLKKRHQEEWKAVRHQIDLIRMKKRKANKRTTEGRQQRKDYDKEIKKMKAEFQARANRELAETSNTAEARRRRKTERTGAKVSALQAVVKEQEETIAKLRAAALAAGITI